MHLNLKTGSETTDTLAEWLRRRPAKPLGSARGSSNLPGVGNMIRLRSLSFYGSYTQHDQSGRLDTPRSS